MKVKKCDRCGAIYEKNRSSQKNSRKAGKQECLKNSRKEYNDCGSSTENSVGGVYARRKTDQ